MDLQKWLHNWHQLLTTLIFNIVMIKYLGEDGVAAITIILYPEMLLNAAI